MFTIKAILVCFGGQSCMPVNIRVYCRIMIQFCLVVTPDPVLRHFSLFQCRSVDR